MNNTKAKRTKSYKYETEGKIVSALFLFALLFILPSMLKPLWGNLIEIASKIGRTDVWMFVIVSMGVNVAALLINNLIMLYVYKAKSPFFEQYRISPETPWPWEKEKDWTATLRRTLLIVFFNGLVVNFAVTIGQSYVHELKYEYSIEKWPSHLQIFTHFTIFFLYNEVISYLAHWAFHSPSLYRIHKQHHEYKTTISLTATYAHPIEYIFSNLLAAALCIPLLSLITEVHLVTIVPWIFFRLTQTIEVHSGYEFPWGCITFMPWKNDAAFHDFHHSHNWGTYGSMLCWMDKLMGTDRQYNKYYKLE